jgi:uncharacterized protein (DUF736 family)
MKIGHFSRDTNGIISGSISTFGGQFEFVYIAPTGKEAPNPQFMIETKGCELGAAWEKISKNDKPYMSVLLRGPFLPQPIWANLFEDENSPGNFVLLWSEPRKNKSKTTSSNRRSREEYDDIPY